MEIDQSDAVTGGGLSKGLYYIMRGQNSNDESTIPPPKVNLALEEAVEAHRVVRRRGSHIF
jgi:hypothetical protein